MKINGKQLNIREMFWLLQSMMVLLLCSSFLLCLHGYTVLKKLRIYSTKNLPISGINVISKTAPTISGMNWILLTPGKKRTLDDENKTSTNIQGFREINENNVAFPNICILQNFFYSVETLISFWSKIFWCCGFGIYWISENISMCLKSNWIQLCQS